MEIRLATVVCNCNWHHECDLRWELCCMEGIRRQAKFSHRTHRPAHCLAILRCLMQSLPFPLSPSAARLISGAFNITSRFFLNVCICLCASLCVDVNQCARGVLANFSCFGFVNVSFRVTLPGAVTRITRQFSLWCRVQSGGSVCALLLPVSCVFWYIRW